MTTELRPDGQSVCTLVSTSNTVIERTLRSLARRAVCVDNPVSSRRSPAPVLGAGGDATALDCFLFRVLYWGECVACVCSPRTKSTGVSDHRVRRLSNTGGRWWRWTPAVLAAVSFFLLRSLPPSSHPLNHARRLSPLQLYVQDTRPVEQSSRGPVC